MYKISAHASQNAKSICIPKTISLLQIRTRVSNLLTTASF